MKVYWNRLKHQAQENPLFAIAAGAALLTATGKLINAVTNYRNSHAWAKEVQRRIMNDMLKKK